MSSQFNNNIPLGCLTLSEDRYPRREKVAKKLIYPSTHNNTITKQNILFIST